MFGTRPAGWSEEFYHLKENFVVRREQKLLRIFSSLQCRHNETVTSNALRFMGCAWQQGNTSGPGQTPQQRNGWKTAVAPLGHLLCLFDETKPSQHQVAVHFDHFHRLHHVIFPDDVLHTNSRSIFLAGRNVVCNLLSRLESQLRFLLFQKFQSVDWQPEVGFQFVVVASTPRHCCFHAWLDKTWSLVCYGTESKIDTKKLCARNGKCFQSCLDSLFTFLWQRSATVRSLVRNHLMLSVFQIQFIKCHKQMTNPKLSDQTTPRSNRNPIFLFRASGVELTTHNKSQRSWTDYEREPMSCSPLKV